MRGGISSGQPRPNESVAICSNQKNITSVNLGQKQVFRYRVESVWLELICEQPVIYLHLLAVILIEEAGPKIGCFVLIDLILHQILCLVHDLLIFKFDKDLDLVLLFFWNFCLFKRVETPVLIAFVKDVHAISVIDAIPLLLERPFHLVKIDLLHPNWKHVLHILSGDLAATFYIRLSYNLSSLNENWFDLDCCTRRDFTLGQETEVNHNFWLTWLIGVHLLNHSILHHV